MQRIGTRGLMLIAIVALVAAACGDTTDDAATTTAGTQAPTTTSGSDTTAATTTTAAATTTTEAVNTTDLASVCPSPLIIQTDWFPESEHGALYNLVGPDYTVDPDNQITRSQLIAAGVDTGIEIEIRAGGPAIGFQPVATQMYTDSELHLGYVSNDEQALFVEDAPTLAVAAPLDKNPQIVQWDPETYPEVESIADLGELDVTVNVFAGGTFIEVFVNEGILGADQIDPSYDGSPARFIASQGEIAQQGFASESPYSYEIVFEEWAKPIAFELIHDAGLEIYSQPLAIRTSDLETMRPCLERFVPIVQQSVVDFANSPDRANAIIVDAVEQIGSFWVYPPELAQFSVDTQIELGLVGNGSDATVANFDLDRVQGAIDKMAAAGLGVPEGLQASDIVTNEFIDPSIGF